MKLFILSVFLLLTPYLTQAEFSDCVLKKCAKRSEIIKLYKTGKKMDDKLNEGERWSDYFYDDCTEEIVNNIMNDKIYKCLDGTVTVEQPDSTGLWGWSGYCGETAISNINFMYCDRLSDPDEYIATDLTFDSTPGTRPSIVKNGLNTYFNSKEDCPKGEWELYDEASSPEEYLSYLVAGLEHKGIYKRKNQSGNHVEEISPFPILVGSFPLGSNNRHWITLVGIEGYEGEGKYLSEQKNCYAFVNHWGNQYKIPCHRLAKAAESSGNGPVGFVVNSYPRVKFIPNK